MDDRKFGDILADRRRALRKSIDQVSQATGLNHAAITAFESSNFAAMPAGYAQNMITTYSRYLGLDPSEMARLYHRQYERFEKNQDFRKAARKTTARLDDDSYESGTRRRSSRSTSFESRSSLLLDKAPTRKMNVDDQDYLDYQARLRAPRSSSSYFEYDPVDDRARQRQALEKRTSRGDRYEDDPWKTSRTSKTNRGAQRSSSSRKSSQSSRSKSASSSRFTSLSTDDKRRLMLIGGVLIGLLVVLICVALAVRSLVSSPAADDSTNDVSSVQSQIAQRNTSSSSTPAAPAQQTPNTQPTTQQDTPGQSAPQIPTKSVVTYTVEKGKSTWIEVTIDGKNVFAGTAGQNDTKSFDVTGELEMTVSDPSAVKVTKNGETAPLVENNGIATLKVIFADDLAEFKRKYPNAKPAAESSTNTSSESQ